HAPTAAVAVKHIDDRIQVRYRVAVTVLRRLVRRVRNQVDVHCPSVVTAWHTDNSGLGKRNRRMNAALDTARATAVGAVVWRYPLSVWPGILESGRGRLVGKQYLAANEVPEVIMPATVSV